MDYLKTTFTFLLGAGLGVAAGILAAPKKGKRTRADLSNFIGDKKDQLEDIGSKRLAEAKSFLNETVEKQTSTAKKGLDKVKEVAKVS